ncbi:hypothetical protein [Flagellimonas algicola]|uniref:UbiA prenyltransferase family protein n=1 Tax=Flagellimonas algicola TaxID=2583815 RepID=A0ABY2WS92_9FLAO|nr:hypothetical protein [Allomuricauda algicola]TMU57620.1 hypothetical protein FGG15_08750 [Allomuricauda algicola]
MRLIKSIFDFYLNASVHVGLAVMALTGVTLVLLDIPLNYFLLGFTGCSTVVCYNFIKYGVEAEKYLIVSNLYHRYIQIFSFLCFGLAMYFMSQLDQKLWWTIGVLGLVSTLYAVPLLPKSGNLRSLGGMKIFIVALVWAGFTVLLPILDAQLPYSWDIGVLFAQRFLLVLILILPFEIRDLKWDSMDLRTLPQILGVQRTKKVGVGLIISFLLLTFLRDDIKVTEVLTRIVIGTVLLALFRSKLDFGKRYLASFWVEGIPMFWLAILWVLKGMV